MPGRIMKRLVYILLSVGWLVLPMGVAAQTVIVRDSLALIALFEATGGPNWDTQDGAGTRSDWVFTGNDPEKPRPTSAWSGVIVRDRLVDRLLLSSNNLVGTIPDRLGHLTQPRGISLSNNSGANGNLTGSIPDTLGSLISLEQLSLSRNALSGPLPLSLGRLVNLQQLWLGNNQLTGTIPDTLTGLTQLEILELGDNQLTGPIPADIGNLTSLQQLELVNNQLTGPLPASLGNLANLVSLRLGSTSTELGNQFSGPLPEGLGNLAALQTLDLFLAGVEGPLPASLGNLTELRTMQLSSNRLEGPIPESWGNLSNIVTISLAFNQLTGDVPASFTQLATLQTLNLHGNALESVPDLSDLPALRQLRLFNNRLTFHSLEPLAGLRDNPNVTTFFYAPQDSVDTRISRDDGQVELFVSVGGEETTYRWFRNDEEIVGAEDSTYVVPNPNDSAIYRAEARNPLLPGLVLYSRKIGINPQLVVNSTGDRSLKDDAVPGVCDTGEVIVRVALEEPECTLRAAIETANQTTDGIIEIVFAIPGTSTPDISLGEFQGINLPALLRPVVIDGTTQIAGQVTLTKRDRSFVDDGLRLRSRGSTVRGLRFDDDSGEDFSGITLQGEGGHTVEQCVFYDLDEGVIALSPGNTIRESFFIAPSTGILLTSATATANVVEHNFFGINEEGEVAGRVGFGVFIRGAATQNIIRENVLANSNYGVFFGAFTPDQGEAERPFENTITDNVFYLSIAGVVLRQATNNLIQNNNIFSNGTGVIFAENATHNTVDGNIIGINPDTPTEQAGNVVAGIEIKRFRDFKLPAPQGNVIQNNLIAKNSGNGIHIEFGSDTILANNRIAENGASGIYLDESWQGTISNTTIRDNHIGLPFDGSTLDGNGEHGIEVEAAANTRILDNVITENAVSGIFISGLGSRNTSVLNNRIGTDETGRRPFGNTRYGLHVQDAAFTVIGSNVISANGESGVYLEATPVQFEFNKIGTDASGNDPLGDLGNARFGVEIHNPYVGVPSEVFSNTVAYNGATGLHLEGVGAMFVQQNHLHHNATGLAVANVADEVVIQSNLIERNRERGLDATEIDRLLLIRLNTIRNNGGTGTGIHLTAAHALIEGNELSGDAGDAIALEQGSMATITGNNVFGNAGFGLHSLDASVPLVVAQGNWWGDASGPGGQGPGTGDAVSPNVDFAPWRTEPVAVGIAPAAEILTIAEVDTVSFFVQNWQVRNDVLTLDVRDDAGWLEGPATFDVALTDSLGARVDLPVQVPGGSPVGATSMGTAIATSQANPAHADTTTFMLSALSTALVQLLVLPETVEVAPGDTVQFTALGFDAFNQSVPVTPSWSTSGGTIDANGLFVAGETAGRFEVRAEEPTTGRVAVARVFNDIPVATEETEKPPGDFRLLPNYPNPFNQTTTIPYDLPTPARVRLVVYDVLGRTVAMLIDGDQTAGSHQVSFDARALPSGLYFYRLTADAHRATRSLLLLR